MFINISGRLMLINASIIIREIAFAVCRAKGKAKPGKGRHAGCRMRYPPGPGMLRFVRPVPGSRYTMRRSSSWTMTCRLINFYNCMHSFQCGFEVVFTVNVHCLFVLCIFYFFYLQLFYSLCVFDTWAIPCQINQFWHFLGRPISDFAQISHAYSHP